MASRPSMRTLGLPALLAVILMVIYLWPTSPAASNQAASTSVPSRTTTSGAGVSQRGDQLMVALSGLPPEAAETWALIEDGGPYPFDRDGVVFSNFERHLPERSSGYYREYTVPTPGVRSRGARRLIVGREDDVFYTDDHYDSFVQIEVDR